VEKCGRAGQAHMTVWRKRIACWVPKPKNTHSEYVILIAFPVLQWLHERASMLPFPYTACLVELHVRRPKVLTLFPRTPRASYLKKNEKNSYQEDAVSETQNNI